MVNGIGNFNKLNYMYTKITSMNLPVNDHNVFNDIPM